MKLKVILICLCLTGLLYAQSGGIKGKIIDAKTKQPMSGANVMILGTDLGAATNNEGIFIINNVPENVYKLSVKFMGYNEHIEPDVRVIRDKYFYTKEIELIESALLSDEVVVSSGYFNESLETPVSFHSYTKEEIVRAPGAAGDIFRAIENLPGVTSSGGEFSAFSVRGSGPKSNIILVDNIPFANISHFTEASGDEAIEGGRFSIFSTGLIEKAEFYGGGFSSKYGGKLASALNLTLKEGNKESFSANGSYDLLGWEVNYDGPTYLLENTSLRVSARSYDYKTIMNLIDEIGQGHPKMSDYIMKLTSDINPSNKLSFIGIYSTETSLRNLTHIYDGDALDNRDLRDETEDKYLAGLNWRFLPNEKSYLNTSLYYSRTDTKQKEGRAYTEEVLGLRPTRQEVKTRFPIGIYSSKQDILGLKSDFSYNVSKSLSVNLGLNIQNVKYDSYIQMNGLDTLYQFDEAELVQGGDKFLIIDPAVISNTYNKKRTEYAGYGELSYSVTDKLHLNAGIRYEYDNISDRETFSPRFSGTYSLSPVTSINFAAGIYYQLPEMMLLSGDRRNGNIKSEMAYHYILGLTRYLSDDIKFTAEAYYKDLENLIVNPNSNDGLALNTGSGYAYGVDLSLLKRFVDKVYGQVNYSYGISKVKDKSSDSYYNSTFNQPHIFNILVGYQLNASWSVTAKWKYASGRPKDSYIIYEDVHNNPAKMRYAKSTISVNTGRYKAFHSLNLRVDYRHQFSKFLAITAFIDILNAYGNDNYFMESFNETTGEIEGEGLQFIPTIGFKLEI